MNTLTHVLFALSISCCAASGGIISVLPSSTVVGLGSPESVTINVVGLTDLYAFQFDLTFNPSVFTVAGVNEGGLFNSVGVSFSPGTINNSAGTITFIGDSLSGSGPGISTSGTLVQITLTSIGAGSSSISLANVVLLDSALNDITATASGTAVTVTAGSPEPGSMVLLVTGLGVGYFLKRRCAPNARSTRMLPRDTFTR